MNENAESLFDEKLLAFIKGNYLLLSILNAMDNFILF